MKTEVHYDMQSPGATDDQMRALEALMRHPDHVEAHLAMTNAMARLLAKKAGLPVPTITGTIHAVTH